MQLLAAKSVVEVALRARLKELEAQAGAEIRAISGVQVESRGTAPPIKVCTYRDELSDGSQRIVVQASRERFFGIYTQVCADGFVLLPDGQRRPLTEEERWPFL